MKETQLEKYIRLMVPEKLSKEDSKLWFDVVKQSGPENIVGSMQAVDNDGNPRNVQMLSKKFGDGVYTYEIPLTRSLLERELAEIVEAWVHAYEGDFQIDSDSEFLTSLIDPNL